MKRVLKLLLWVIKNIEELVAGAALITMVGITVVNVFSRYVFRSAIPWAEELAVIGLVWSTFIGMAACYKRKAHLGIDFVVSHLPVMVQKWLQMVLMVAMVAFFGYMAYISGQFALAATKTTPFFHLNYFYLNIAVALGFLSMTIYSVGFFVMGITNPEKFAAIYVIPPAEKNEDGSYKEDDK